MTFVLDAGAFIAIERGDSHIVALVTREKLQRRVPVTSSGVVAQVWRGGARQAVLAKVLGGLKVRALTHDTARALGVLLGRNGTSDVVDAHIAWLAKPGDVILTSNPDDLRRLVATRRVNAAVRKV